MASSRCRGYPLEVSRGVLRGAIVAALDLGANIVVAGAEEHADAFGAEKVRSKPGT